MVFCLASVSLHALLFMNDTGLVFPGRARRDDRTSRERAKLESSFLPNRRLAVRLSATVKTCTTMRGRTRELGGASRMRTLKYAFASFGSTTALEITMSIAVHFPHTTVNRCSPTDRTSRLSLIDGRRSPPCRGDSTGLSTWTVLDGHSSQ